MHAQHDVICPTLVGRGPEMTAASQVQIGKSALATVLGLPEAGSRELAAPVTKASVTPSPPTSRTRVLKLIIGSSVEVFFEDAPRPATPST